MINNIYFVEDCTAITAKEALRIASRLKNIKTKTTDVECWLDADDSNALWLRTIDQEPQRITLEWIALNFGYGAYFECTCGFRASKLYLIPHGKNFACRVCQKLKYRRSSINPNSVAGRAIYKFDRMNKLAETRANMRGIFWKGTYTHRYNRFLAQCSAVGLHGVVNDARELLEVVKVHGTSTNTGN